MIRGGSEILLYRFYVVSVRIALPSDLAGAYPRSVARIVISALLIAAVNIQVAVFVSVGFGLVLAPVSLTALWMVLTHKRWEERRAALGDHDDEAARNVSKWFWVGPGPGGPGY